MSPCRPALLHVAVVSVIVSFSGGDGVGCVVVHTQQLCRWLSGTSAFSFHKIFESFLPTYPFITLFLEILSWTESPPPAIHVSHAWTFVANELICPTFVVATIGRNKQLRSITLLYSPCWLLKCVERFELVPEETRSDALRKFVGEQAKALPADDDNGGGLKRGFLIQPIGAVLKFIHSDDPDDKTGPKFEATFEVSRHRSPWLCGVALRQEERCGVLVCFPVSYSGAERALSLEENHHPRSFVLESSLDFDATRKYVSSHGDFPAFVARCVMMERDAYLSARGFSPGMIPTNKP